MRVYQSEILVLIVPQGAADAMAVKNLANILVPAQGILGRCLVDDAVFAALEGRVVGFGRFNRRCEHGLEELRPQGIHPFASDGPGQIEGELL